MTVLYYKRSTLHSLSLLEIQNVQMLLVFAGLILMTTKGEIYVHPKHDHIYSMIFHTHIATCTCMHVHLFTPMYINNRYTCTCVYSTLYYVYVKALP